MSDLIDRQAAIDEIKAVYEWHDYVTMERLIEHIRKLPSAQPYTEAEIQKMQDLEQAELDKAFELGKEEGRKEAQPEPHWIPCSDRMPDQYGNYLVSIEGDEPDIGTINPNNPRGWSLCDASGFYWASDKYLNITAWMPLPEPYREEGETDAAK